MLKAMAMRGSRISNFPKKHEREQPSDTLVLEHHQKEKYLYFGLKASSHTKIVCFRVAFGTRGRYLTRRRAAVCLLAFKLKNNIFSFLLAHDMSPKATFSTNQKSRKFKFCSILQKTNVEGQQSRHKQNLPGYQNINQLKLKKKNEQLQKLWVLSNNPKLMGASAT